MTQTPQILPRRKPVRGDLPPAATELRELREALGDSQAQLADRLQMDLRTIKRWETGKPAAKAHVLDYLRKVIRERAPQSLHEESTTSFTFVDLFAGIGGLRRGFEAVGGKCVFTSEWDKYSQQTYRANFQVDHELAGDIVQVASSEIAPHDVLLAGFPCQPFSIAGVSKKNSLGRPHGFDCDTQGTLFFEVERILRYHRPRAFLLENVKNLTTHDGGRTFRVIMTVLREQLGYHVFPRVIDAKGFLPQHRERIFLVGFRDDVDFDWSAFPAPTHPAPTLSEILHAEDGSETPEPPYTGSGGLVDKKYVLSDHLWGYLQDYAAKHKAKGNGFGFGLFDGRDVARTLSARYHKDGSEILIRREGGNPRRLTPRECARLMGFDTNASERMRIPVSDTQAYRQFGNSVAVPVVSLVARLMKPFLAESSRRCSDLPLRNLVADR